MHLQADISGAAISCLSISPSGEGWALGGPGGSVRLWAESEQPVLHPAPAALELPPADPDPPGVALTEESGFAAALLFPQNPELGGLWRQGLGFKTKYKGTGDSLRGIGRLQEGAWAEALLQGFDDAAGSWSVTGRFQHCA